MVPRRSAWLWKAAGYDEVLRLGDAVVLVEESVTGARAVLRYVPMRVLANRKRYPELRTQLTRLAEVSDPRVLPFQDFVTDPRLARPDLHVGTGYGGALVYEAVAGADLRRLLQRNTPLAPEAALVVAKDARLGLAAAHRHGVRPNVLAPHRMIATDEGRILLTGLALGTIEEPDFLYRAPELWRHEPDSMAADCYSLGCVLFECLTGRSPFRRSALFSLMSAHTTAARPLEVLPVPLRPLLAEALAKEPPRDLSPTKIDALAKATYGPDWESRGRRALAERAAPFIQPFPPPAPRPPMP
ncbi:protein kinase domain-containing protein [Actinomadura formosensis]|uniref:protein kinase domain-containing protein n=1 Tax=Actinomadura formosensis TaxID=60706 RepID=UPI000831353E